MIELLYYNANQMSIGYMVFDQKTQLGDFWSKIIWPTKYWTNTTMTLLFSQQLITLELYCYNIMTTKCLLAKCLSTKRHSLGTSGQKPFGQQSVSPTQP